MACRSVLASFVLLASSSYALAQCEATKLTASDATAGDFFGCSVGISGDYLIVGAHCDDDLGYRSGSAYVFKHHGGSWVESQKLNASDGMPHDSFGGSIAMDGQVALVGAPGKNDVTGAVYVFRYNGSTWLQEDILTASDGEASDGFGLDESVAISGQFIAVGAHHDKDVAYNAGSAYVFRDEGGTFIEETKLLPPPEDAIADYIFGNALALDGNLLAVGAREAVYLFEHAAEGWVEQGKLTASDGEWGDSFGVCSISINGDTIAVGAGWDDDHGGNSGAVYMFRQDQGTWTEETKLTASDAEGSMYFGAEVYLGREFVVVGTATGPSHLGAAYIFVHEEDNWLEEVKLGATDPHVDDNFGGAVFGSENWLVIGALYHDGLGEWSGAAYVHRIPCELGIPAVSAWGMLAMTLLLLAAGTVVLRRPQAARA